jgi:hypothetical protein
MSLALKTKDAAKINLHLIGKVEAEQTGWKDRSLILVFGLSREAAV